MILFLQEILVVGVIGVKLFQKNLYLRVLESYLYISFVVEIVKFREEYEFYVFCVFCFFDRENKKKRFVVRVF